LEMLHSGGGWSDQFLSLAEIDGDSQTLKERILTPFIESVAKL